MKSHQKIMKNHEISLKNHEQSRKIMKFHRAARPRRCGRPCAPRPTAHGVVEGSKVRRLAKSVSKTPSERPRMPENTPLSVQKVSHSLPKCLNETSYSMQNGLPSTTLAQPSRSAALFFAPPAEGAGARVANSLPASVHHSPNYFPLLVYCSSCGHQIHELSKTNTNKYSKQGVSASIRMPQ